MDRPIVYPGQVPRSLDNLNLGQFAMVGLAKLSEAMLGTATAIVGFAVTPVSPASLSVNIGAGQIYEMENLEASAVSGLGVDTHSILKQGINLDPQTLTFTPPLTVGFAQNFLIEVEYQDSDSGQLLLTYQNPANSGQTYQGPGGNGQQQNTVRKGVAALAVKAGVAATSGTQTTPSPDAGYVGVAVITVAYGQTTITSGNITPYAAAPTIPVTLPGVPSGVQANQWTYAVDQSGAAGTIVANLSPIPLAFPDGLTVNIKTANAAAGNDVANVNSLGNLPIKRRGGGATAANDWPAGSVITLRKVGSAWQYGGIAPSDIATVTYGSTSNGFLALNGSNFGLSIANGVADNRTAPVGGDKLILWRAADGTFVTVLDSALATYILSTFTATQIFNITNQAPPGTGFAGSQSNFGFYYTTAGQSHTLSSTFTAPSNGVVTCYSTLNTSSTNPNIGNQATIGYGGTTATGSADSVSNSSTSICSAAVTKGQSVTVTSIVTATAAMQNAASQYLNYTFIPA